MPTGSAVPKPFSAVAYKTRRRHLSALNREPIHKNFWPLVTSELVNEKLLVFLIAREPAKITPEPQIFYKNQHFTGDWT